MLCRLLVLYAPCSVLTVVPGSVASSRAMPNIEHDSHYQLVPAAASCIKVTLHAVIHISLVLWCMDRRPLACDGGRRI